MASVLECQQRPRVGDNRDRLAATKEEQQQKQKGTTTIFPRVEKDTAVFPRVDSPENKARGIAGATAIPCGKGVMIHVERDQRGARERARGHTISCCVEVQTAQQETK